jgi:hypothetical protein
VSTKEAVVAGRRKLRNEDLMMHFSLVIFPVTKSREMKRRDTEGVWGEDRFLHTFGRGNLKERNHLESLGTDEMTVTKYSKEYDWSGWEEKKGAAPMRTRCQNFGFHKIRRFPWPVYQEGFCFAELLTIRCWVTVSPFHILPKFVTQSVLPIRT